MIIGFSNILVYALTIVVFGVFIIGLIQNKKRKWSNADYKFFDENYANILKIEDKKLQILELDKLLDKMLGRRGYQGSLGGKLKKYDFLYSEIDQVWAAHKIRNNIAHQLDYKVNDKDYQTALKGFRRAFKDLGLM